MAVLISYQELNPFNTDIEFSKKCIDSRSLKTLCYNPGQNIWDTLCFGEENVIQVDPPPLLKVLGVTSQTPLTYPSNVKDLNFVQGGGGRGGNLVKAVFKNVYCRLAANSIQKHVKKGR